METKTLIILITHANTASAFVEAVKNMHIEINNNTVLAFDIHNADKPEPTSKKIINQISNNASLYTSAVFATDLIGSTPYNIAKQCSHMYGSLENKNSALITGLNLPMLLKLLNYQHLPASELAEKTCCTGAECIMYQPQEPDSNL